jgi:TolB-like protein/class 3 adenylate cyclase/Flp pilus assembly protein TadD
MTEQKVRRRLAAILAADIAEYSRLMGQDEVATVRDLKGHQVAVLPLVDKFGGRIIDTAGDGIMAEFPSAFGAVECATEIQRVMAARNRDEPEDRRMQYRVGINLGDVIHDETRIYGEGINVAARLENIAEPGGVCISEDVYRQVRDKMTLSCRDLGEQVLKNISRPVRVYALTGAAVSLAAGPGAAANPLGAPQPSIVVLPFVNMSSAADNEYFADGLSEELLNVLAKIRGLRVISRTSAFSFKGQKIDLPTIAQRLGVAHVLEGSVRRAGNRVRITAQLIKVENDSHLWSETYERELDELFAVQDDIARAVVKELRTALMGDAPGEMATAALKEEIAAAAKGRPESADAYSLYLQGLFFADRITQEDLAKGIGFFRQAVGLEPAFALAWAGLSHAHMHGAGYSLTPMDQGFAEARAAAARALELEPDLPEGHVALGLVQMNYDWDWHAADASFRRALALAPGNTEVLRGAAVLAGIIGRHDEAVALARRAAILDPLSTSAHRTLGARCLSAGLLDEAEAVIKKAIEINPQGGLLHCWLGRVHLSQGKIVEARAAFEKEVIEFFRVQGLALIGHAQGRRSESDAALRGLIDQYASESAYQVAEVYASRGELDLAFQWLARAHAQHDPGLIGSKSNALLRSLHGDPRWPAFLEKMGLA